MSSTEKKSHSQLVLETLSVLYHFSQTILSHIILLLHRIFFKKTTCAFGWVL